MKSKVLSLLLFYEIEVLSSFLSYEIEVLSFVFYLTRVDKRKCKSLISDTRIPCIFAHGHVRSSPHSCSSLLTCFNYCSHDG